MRVLVDGSSGALDAEFLWVHNTELADPSTYVREDELVLTNGLWLAKTTASAFVSSLRRVGAAGVVFGLRAEMSTTPRELVDACERADLPLAEISTDVPFTEISQAAAAIRAELRHESLISTIRRGNALASALSSGAGASGVLRLVRRDHDLPLAVVDRMGRRLAAIECELDDNQLRAVAAALGHHPPPLEVDLGEPVGRAAIFLIGAVSDSDAALLCLRAVTMLNHAQRDALDQAARFLSLEVAKRQAVQATEVRFASELLDMMLSGSQRVSELSARLRSFGVDPNGRLAVLALASDDADLALAPGLADAVSDFFLAQGQAVVVAVGSQDVVVVMPWQQRAVDLVAVLQRLVQEIDTQMRGRVVIGLGDVAESASTLRRPLLQAREGCRVLRHRSGEQRVAAFSELGTHRLLLGLHDQETLRGFADSVLEPLRSHDRDRDDHLLSTVRAFLEHDGRWAETASALYVHVNTVRNRLAKVAELTGRDIGHTGDRVDLFLALEADEMGDGT